MSLITAISDNNNNGNIWLLFADKTRNNLKTWNKEIIEFINIKGKLVYKYYETSGFYIS